MVRITFLAEKGDFFPSTASRLALGPTQSPVHWIPRFVFTEEKRQEREADHSPQFSVEVQKGAAVTPLLHSPTPPLPHLCSLQGAQLIKYRNKFTFLTVKKFSCFY
jgi:hypothetical protein